MKKIKFTDHLNEGVSNKYEIIMLASQRTLNLNNGSSTILEKDNHKNTVIALTEMENDKLDILDLRENLIRKLQTNYINDELQEDYVLEEDNEFQIDLIDIDNFDELLNEDK